MRSNVCIESTCIEHRIRNGYRELCNHAMQASQAEFFKQRFVEKNAHDIMDAYEIGARIVRTCARGALMNKLYRISTSIYSEQLTNWQRRSNSGRLALENLNPLFVFTANILNILLYDGQSAECKIHVTENAKMQSAIYPRAESRKDMQIYSARVWRFGRKNHMGRLYIH